jgi:hypothetical protein
MKYIMISLRIIISNCSCQHSTLDTLRATQASIPPRNDTRKQTTISDVLNSRHHQIPGVMLQVPETTETMLKKFLYQLMHSSEL